MSHVFKQNLIYRVYFLFFSSFKSTTNSKYNNKYLLKQGSTSGKQPLISIDD